MNSPTEQAIAEAALIAQLDAGIALQFIFQLLRLCPEELKSKAAEAIRAAAEDLLDATDHVPDAVAAQIALRANAALEALGQSPGRPSTTPTE